jgi:ATPase
MRNTKDFLLYSDLRISGVGLVGVMHATKPVDAIQRFVGRIELGVIPHVIDTVIFIKNGQIEKVLNLEMTVKVPSGMTEADLARPVVTVSDFETGRLEVEIYSYGEETVVITVSEIKDVENPLKRLAEKEIERSLHDYTNKVKVVIISDGRAEVYVPSESIARIIGKEGKTVSELEKQFGLKLDIRELSEKVHIVKQHKENVSFEVSQSSGNLNIFLPREYAESEAEIVVDGRYLLAAAVSKKGVIKLRLNSKIGQTLANDLKARRRVEVLV